MSLPLRESVEQKASFSISTGKPASGRVLPFGMVRRFLPLLFVPGTFLVFTCIAYAAMQSPNFRFESESFNVGGIESEGSANYHMSETIGEPAIGSSDSASYQVSAGYRGFVGTVPIPTPTSSANPGGECP
jgi:hypothetical protein